MREIHELYEEFEKLDKRGDYQQAFQYFNEASVLFRANYSGFTAEEMINGFKYGTELLQRNTSGIMISEKYFHPDYRDVMVQSIREDKFVSNYKFIFTLKKRLSRRGLIDILKISLHSHDHKTQVNSLFVAKEELLVELIPEVEEISLLPNINREEVVVPDYFKLDPNLYIDHIERNRESIIDYAKKTLQLLRDNQKD